MQNIQVIQPNGHYFEPNGNQLENKTISENIAKNTKMFISKIIYHL